MRTLHVRSHVGSDGLLKLEIPVDVKDVDYQVVVVIQPVAAAQRSPTSEELGWPKDFFEQTVGKWEGDFPFDSEGEFEKRAEL